MGKGWDGKFVFHLFFAANACRWYAPCASQNYFPMRFQPCSDISVLLLDEMHVAIT